MIYCVYSVKLHLCFVLFLKVTKNCVEINEKNIACRKVLKTQNKTKQKQNKSKQNKTKPNKTKQNKTQKKTNKTKK